MTLIRTCSLATAAAATLALFSIVAVAQDGGQRDDRNKGDRNRTAQFDSHDQQVAHDWYNQQKDHPPVGLRTEDRLSPEQESRLHEGAVLDRDMRRHVHPAPPELARQLPPPPSHHRYVAIGGHIGMIDNGYHVKAVIHLHDN
jgi:Ni/Co efflux regulator RcnB